MTKNIEITKDLANKTLHVTRHFAAPVEKVWKAWTDPAVLDKWWAPRPWQAKTKIHNFTVGGQWLYCMVGPNGEEHWCKVTFTAIAPGKSFADRSVFCDENGNENDSAPANNWLVVFSATGTGSVVNVDLTFDTDTDMQTLIAMGFEGGFTMGLNNLEELLPSL